MSEAGFLGPPLLLWPGYHALNDPCVVVAPPAHVEGGDEKQPHGTCKDSGGVVVLTSQQPS